MLSIGVEYVFKANFNDTYFLDRFEIPLCELSKRALFRFDPFFGRGKTDEKRAALLYCSDKRLTVLELSNGKCAKRKSSPQIGCILCDEYDETRLIAANISLK